MAGAPPRTLLAALLAAAPFASGCLQATFLAQAAAGQDDLAWRARPIEDAIADDAVPANKRHLLGLVEDVKRYGEQHGLTRTKSYREYVDIGREAVVWVVTASQALRFEPVTWSFPVVGSVPYLGWFEKSDAERQADELRRAGYDVWLREARAYSTLGWFRDPVLSTMLDDGPTELVNVVLHESVHSTHYVASQAPFNESMASFVADKLTQQYLSEKLHVDRWQLYDFRDAQIASAGRAKRMHEYYLELAALYASALPDEEKLAKKAAIFARLQRETGGRRLLNNAAIAGAQTYDSGGVGFATVFKACGGDFVRFMKVMGGIDTKDFRGPDQRDFDAVVTARARECS